MDANVSRSIFSLCKNNNGYFKSEKQAKFLISEIEKYDGCVGIADSGYNQCPQFAEFDEKGITKILKSTKSKTKGYKDVIVFERKSDAEIELHADGNLAGYIARTAKNYKPHEIDELQANAKKNATKGEQLYINIRNVLQAFPNAIIIAEIEVSELMLLHNNCTTLLQEIYLNFAPEKAKYSDFFLLQHFFKNAMKNKGKYYAIDEVPAYAFLFLLRDLYAEKISDMQFSQILHMYETLLHPNQK